MKKSELRELLRNVETVRSELHPELDPDFLTAVISAEEENSEDPSEAMREIRAALEKTLARKRGR